MRTMSIAYRCKTKCFLLDVEHLEDKQAKKVWRALTRALKIITIKSNLAILTLLLLYFLICFTQRISNINAHSLVWVQIKDICFLKLLVLANVVIWETKITETIVLVQRSTQFKSCDSATSEISGSTGNELYSHLDSKSGVLVDMSRNSGAGSGFL